VSPGRPTPISPTLRRSNSRNSSVLDDENWNPISSLPSDNGTKPAVADPFIWTAGISFAGAASCGIPNASSLAYSPDVDLTAQTPEHTVGEGVPRESVPSSQRRALKEARLQVPVVGPEHQTTANTGNVQMTSRAAESTSSSSPQSVLRVNHEPSELLDYYFTDVCRINSAFDSATNPFRFVISKYVRESPLVMHCILSVSMSALAQRNKRVLPSAVHYHSAAVSHFSEILNQVRDRDASDGQDENRLPKPLALQEIKGIILATVLLGISTVSLVKFSTSVLRFYPENLKTSIDQRY